MKNTIEIQTLSTPMLTVLLGSDRFFLELDDNDEALINAVKEELAKRNWPAGLSDAELREAEMAVPMGDPIYMVAQEMDRRGLKSDDDEPTPLTPKELQAIEEGASVCEEHHYIRWADDRPCADCIRLGRMVDGPVTPEEYAQVVEARWRTKAQQAWDVAKASHDSEACGKFTDCEFCIELEHDRMLAENPELAAGEEALMQATVRDVAAHEELLRRITSAH